MSRRAAPAPELLALLKPGENGDHYARAWCPWCRKWHQHGWPAGSSRHTAQHRAAHCTNEDSPFNATGYFIRIPSRADLERDAADALATDALAREGEVAR